MSSPFSISADALAALQAERDALLQQTQRLQDALRVRTVERDLLREQLKAFQRKLFAARSEARSSEQRDLFLNKAEALTSASLAEPEGIRPIA